MYGYYFFFLPIQDPYGQLNDIWERMASKIINVCSDPVIFNATKLRNWNLPKILRHGILRSGEMFCFRWKKINLDGPDGLSAVLAWRGYRTGDFFNEIQWRSLNHGMGCILVQGNYEASSCTGASKRSWIHRHVGTIIALHWRGLFVWRRQDFQQDNAAIHTARR